VSTYCAARTAPTAATHPEFATRLPQFNCPPSFLSGSLQVGLWGAESGDEMGNGESYDGDGVGVNTSAEANHP